jgi:tetratricopeptide (TPR) repeat protein
MSSLKAAVTIALLAGLALPAAAQMSSDEAHRFLLGRIAAEERNFPAALAHFDAILKKSPNDAVLLYERGLVLLESGRLPAAERDLRKAVAIAPDFFDAQRILGRVLLERAGDNQARLDEALAHLQRAFELRPSDFSTGVTLGQIYLRIERLEEAASVFGRLVEASPDNRMLNFNYAQILTRLGRGNESRPYLERVVGADPAFGPAVIQLSEIYEMSGEWGRAAEVLSPLIAAEPLNPDLERRQAYFHLRAGESEKARALLEKLLAAYPRDRATRAFLAEALSDLRRHEEASAIFSELLAENPGDLETLVSAGFNALAARELDQAQRLFTRILEMPSLTEQARHLAETQIAAIEHQRGDYDAALERARQVIVGPEKINRQALNIALDVLDRKKRYDEALELIEPLTSQSTEPFVIARKLEFLYLAGRDEEASQLASSQLATGARGMRLVAETYVQLERFDEAIPYFEKLRAESPDEIDPLFQLGAAYERASRYDDAEKAFLELLEKNAEHAPTLNYLGYMWAEKGVNLERAEKMLINAVGQDPRNGAYVDSLGWVYFQLGKLDLAEEYLTDASRLVPNDATIQEHLGDLFEKKGDLDRAAERYRAALGMNPPAGDEEKIRTKLAAIEAKLAERTE